MKSCPKCHKILDNRTWHDNIYTKLTNRQKENLLADIGYDRKQLRELGLLRKDYYGLSPFVKDLISAYMRKSMSDKVLFDQRNYEFICPKCGCVENGDRTTRKVENEDMPRTNIRLSKGLVEERFGSATNFLEKQEPINLKENYGGKYIEKIEDQNVRCWSTHTGEEDSDFFYLWKKKPSSKKLDYYLNRRKCGNKTTDPGVEFSRSILRDLGDLLLSDDIENKPTLVKKEKSDNGYFREFCIFPDSGKHVCASYMSKYGNGTYEKVFLSNKGGSGYYDDNRSQPGVEIPFYLCKEMGSMLIREADKENC